MWKLLALPLAAKIAAAPVSAEASGPSLREFEDFLRDNPIGSSGDVWLEIRNALGEWERVILVFGYADDFSVCEELIADLRAANRLPREVRCRPANLPAPN